MTIQEVIDGKSTTCPQDWEDLQKELKVLEIDMEKAYKCSDRLKYYELRSKYRAFRLTDTGYIIIRGY